MFTVQYSTVQYTHYSTYIYSRAQDSTVQYLYSLVKGKRSVSERVVLRCSYRGQQEAHEEGGGKAEHGEAFTTTGSVERLSELRYVYIYIYTRRNASYYSKFLSLISSAAAELHGR